MFFFYFLNVFADFSVSVLSEELRMLPGFCFSPLKRNSVLDELRVKRFAVIQEEILEHYVGGHETA